MREQYTRRYALPRHLYIPSAPVIISSGALFWDDDGGRVLARLKFRNISPLEITALTARLIPRDSDGTLLGAPVTFTYQDLSIDRDRKFGRQYYVVLPNPETSRAEVSVLEVQFADGSKWISDGSPWSPLQEPDTLEAALGDAELAREYQIRYGQDCQNIPTWTEDLWYCACGAVNRDQEQSCHRCGRPFLPLTDQLREELIQEKTQRLEAKAQEDLQQKARRAALRKHLRVAGIAAACVALLAVAATLIYHGVARRQALEAQRMTMYQEGLTMISVGAYDEAIRIFGELGDYQDSPEQLEIARNALDAEDLQAKYNDAMFLLEENRAKEAYEILQSLGDYLDASDYHLRHESVLESAHVVSGSYEYTEQYSYDEQGRLAAAVSYDYFRGPTYYAYNDDGSLDYSWNQRGWRGMLGEGYLCTVYTYFNTHGDPETIEVTYEAPEDPDADSKDNDEDSETDEDRDEDENRDETDEDRNEDENREDGQDEADQDADPEDGDTDAEDEDADGEDGDETPENVSITTYAYTYNDDGTIATERQTVDGKANWYSLEYHYYYDDPDSPDRRLMKKTADLHPAGGDAVYAQWETTYQFDEVGNPISAETVCTKGDDQGTITETDEYTYSTTFYLEKDS